VVLLCRHCIVGEPLAFVLNNVFTHHLQRRYFEATSWGDLAIVAQQSTAGSLMDEMIQLFHAGRTRGPQYAVPCVRYVFFRDLQEIPRLLDSPAHSISLRTHDREVDVPGSVGQEAHGIVTNCHTSSTKTIDREMAYSGAAVEGEERTNAEQLELDPTVDMETLTHSLGSAIGHDALIAPSDEQIKAARVIQIRYRRNVLRRSRPMSTLFEARSRLFMECWNESEKIDWLRKGHRILRYRFLFLGPLPHLLLCLERAKAFASEAKKKIKRLLTAAKHQQLEDVQTKMTEAK
jgi:hypothetical protein